MSYRTNSYNPGDATSPTRWYQRRLPPWAGVLAILCLASGVRAQTAALRLNGAQFGASDNTVYVTVKGAKGDGSTDATAAAQAAYTAACASGPGVKVVWPAGNFVITDTLTINCNYLHTEGSGTYATRITFNPASGKALFSVTLGASSAYGFSARNLLLIGQGTQKKTAFDLSDCRACDIQDVEIYSGWTGSTSEGIHIHGREFVTIERFRAAADLPIHVSVSPNTATIGLDHSHFRDMYLFPTTGGGNSAILIDTGVILTNLILDGHQSYIVDKYGIYYNDTTTTQAGANINLENIRCEQAVDPTGYCIYWNEAGSSVMQNMTLNNVYTGTAENGLTVNGVRSLSLRNVEAPTATGVQLSTTNVSDLFIDDCVWVAGGTASISGMTLMVAMPVVNPTSPLAPWAWYSDSTTASTRAMSLSSQVTILGNRLSYTGIANSTPFRFNVTNAFSGGVEIFGWENALTRVAVVDNNGSFRNANGLFDTISGGTAAICANFATSGCTVGKNGVALTLGGLLQTGIPAKANNTIASATTIAPTGFVTHITGTVTIQTITAPTPFAQTNGGGCMTLIFDGVAPWNAAGNIFVAGTPTTAGTNVLFCYDNATSKWYPSRTL